MLWLLSWKGSDCCWHGEGRGASASPARLSGADQLHCVVDLGAAGDHFSLRVVAVQQFGDPYLTDVLAAVAWTAVPRMPDTALVPDHIQPLPDLGPPGRPEKRRVGQSFVRPI